MTNKEKIVALCFTASFLLVVFSSIYTFYQLKPENRQFKIEKMFTNFLK